MMELQWDESSLQEAIRTTLVQLCKVGLVFQQELLIRGTLGVTVDRRSVILVHIDEKVEGGRCPVDSSMPDRQLFSSMPSSTQPIGAPKTCDDNNIPSTSNIDTLPQDLTFKVAIPSTESNNRSTSRLFSLGISDADPIPIDLDSDSESFNALGFEDDDANSVNLGEPRDLKNELLTSDENTSPSDSKFFSDNKNLVLQKETSEPESCPVSEGLSTNLFGADSSQFQNPGCYTVNTNSGTRISLKWQSTSPSHSYSEENELRHVDFSSVIYDKTAPEEKMTSGQRHKRTWPCPSCEKPLPSQSVLECHLVEVHGITETERLGPIAHFDCEKCPKKFRYKPKLDKHIFLHVEDKPYKCYLCSNTYRFQESLNVHMSAHSENSSGNLQCHLCKKDYVSKQLLQKHIIYMHEMRRGGKKS